MKGLIPFGSLTISGPGAATQALSTTFAAFGLFSSTGGANGPASTYDDGDPAVRPDVTNNRLLLEAPGVYEIEAILSGTIDAAQDVAVADLQVRQRFTDAVKNHMSLKGLLVITTADNPGTIATKADPVTSATALYAGLGGFPKTMVPVTLQIKSGASTPTVTAEFAQFIAKRIG